MLKIMNTRCEYRINPLGIDTGVPRFFWQLLADVPRVLQDSYQIQVAIDPGFLELAWDTRRVVSGLSIQIPYAGAALEPKTRYWWRVRAWDNTGHETDYSSDDWFETGLMVPENWQAEWVTPVKPETRQSGCPIFRGSCVLRPGIRSARAYATAAGVYELHANGRRVGDDILAPGWTTYLKRHQYQTYDLTDQVHPGENVLGAILAPGWYLGDMRWNKTHNYYGDDMALLFQAEITYDDGSIQVICADESWQVTGAGPVRMSEIYHGETYDARLEIPGWDLPGFDTTGMAWEAVQQTSLGKQQLIAQENLPVRRIEEIAPIALIQTPAGQTVVDMGQNMVGRLRINVSGQAGEVVEIVHFEVLDQQGNVYLDNLRRAKQTVHYTLKGGGLEVYEPLFTFMGFRYLEIRQFPGQVTLESLRGVVLHSHLEPAGTFECSEPLLNQLQHNILWGQKGNFLDVPTDCPQRDERLGWLGDAQVFIRTACHNMNVAPFFTKWLHDLAADQRADGALPHVAPNILDWDAVFFNDGLDKSEMQENNTSAAWADAVIICPWTLYLCYGDTSILHETYPAMQKYIEHIYRTGDNPYLWNTGFHFGDWLGLDSREGTYVGATDIYLIATAFYAWSVSLLARIAARIGRDDDADRYRDLHRQIKVNFNREYVTPNGRLTSETQTSCVLVLMFDLLESEAHRARTVKTLQKLLHKQNDHLTTGFVGTPYMMHVLSRNGLTELAYKLLQQTDYPSWLYQITKGATTIWEHWDGIKPDGSFWSADMNSFNHYAYGAIGDWMVQVICGLDIDPAGPAFKQFTLAPQPGGGLKYARTSYQSLYGTIRSGWQKIDGGTLYEFTVPANTTATIRLPAGAAAQAKILAGQPDTSGREDDRLVYIVGSGEYKIEVSD